MRAALSEAQAAYQRDEVPVGAVLVRGDVVIAKAGNAPIGHCDPCAHAEILCLRAGAEAIGNYRLSDCDLYVTLEPCMMCVGAILQARIANLYYGASEPKTGAVSSAYHLLQNPNNFHKINVLGGIMAAESSTLLQRFFTELRERKRHQ